MNTQDSRYYENTDLAARVANRAMEVLLNRLAAAQGLDHDDVQSIVCGAAIRLAAVSVAGGSRCCKPHALYNIAQAVAGLTEALSVVMTEDHKMTVFELREAMTAGIDQAREYRP
ncbi:hypothetical protein [Bradyrhizobium sp. Leo121]|uniref:hypothetical protein n=1 Tax=Bradyrhizobium sp. Leo121 TaxID=1571195 RepID=UPI00102A9666|nr:hypothetical protein [Bradyrhizobium sp. Leo121]RZN30476.1 hypothetical protein CWO90_20280 [Bradyrhizobium sp. Leo121]